MNDIEFMLREDSKSKKSAGRGIYGKKNGSKSKRCSLPSDKLSKKELKKLNGECKMYNLSKPMSYSVFCSMPVDLRIEYLTKLRDEFGASLSDIAVMMHVSYNALSVHKNAQLNGKPEFKSYKKSRLDGLAWARFLTQDCDKPAEELKEEKPEVADEPVVIKKLCVDISTPKFDLIQNGNLVLTGKPEDIIHVLHSILVSDQTYRVIFNFDKCEN